jgi:hypothetical protein
VPNHCVTNFAAPETAYGRAAGQGAER